jgi:hypothetical protein
LDSEESQNFLSERAICDHRARRGNGREPSESDRDLFDPEGKENEPEREIKIERDRESRECEIAETDKRRRYPPLEEHI